MLMLLYGAADEKTAIARRYLEPQSMTDAGVPEGSVKLTDSAMNKIIDEYCREAGVRNLKKHLEKVYRKAALKLVQGGARLQQAEVATAPGGKHQPEVGGVVVDAQFRGVEEGSSQPAEPSDAGSVISSDRSKDSTEPSSSSSSSSRSQQQGSSESSSSSAHSNVDEGASSQSSSTASPADSSTPGSTSSTSSDGSTGSTSSGSSTSSTASSNPAQVVYDGDPVVIDSGDLKDYVGLPPFAEDRFYDRTPPGVVMGLAWTAMGGATLYVEAAQVVEVS